MIAAWMLWSIGVGLLLLVAGLAAEKLLEGRRRWVWAVAGTGTVLLTVARLLASGGAGSENSGGGLVISEVTAFEASGEGGLEGVEAAGGALMGTPANGFSTVTIPHDSILHTLDGALLLVWLALSAGLAVWALIGAGRLFRHHRSWEPGTLLGQSVLWSRDTGPALVGLFRPRVVLPSWVADVEAPKQKLILAHEEEHRRAGDGILRFVVATLLIAFPWNPFLWLHYRRMCLALELDCDHRVMQRLPHRRWLYGDLLVRVGVRGGLRPGFAPTAFAERQSFLERRIGKLLSEAPEVGMAQMALFAFTAVLVLGVAMWVPGVTEEAVQPAKAAPFEVGLDPTPLEYYSSFTFDSPVAGVDFHLGLDGQLELRLGVEGLGVPVHTTSLPTASLPVVSLPTAYGVPPLPSDARVMQTPEYVYHTIRPELANPWQVERTLEQEYPAGLRDAGIGGTVVVYLFVNTDGSVSKAILKTSSGHALLDRVALQVAKSARFLPASNEGTPVGIWMEMQVPFSAK